MSTKNTDAAREASRQGDGKFGVQHRNEADVVLADTDASAWNVGPTSWNESFEAASLMRDWEDRLQCAEAVNEAVSVQPYERKDAVAYLALDHARSDDYEDYYTATVLDAQGGEMGTISVPGYTFNAGNVPADFQVDADDEAYDAVEAYAPDTDLTIDVAKVRAYDWDAQQAKVLGDLAKISQRALEG